MLDGLYIIIVNWNLAGDTIACVQSLLEAGAPAGRIVVVDNGSTDHSVADLQAAFGAQIWLIPSPENLGFAAGNNLALSACLPRAAQWLLLINNDTIVAPNFLERLAACTAAHPDYALFAPLILYYDDPCRIWSLGDRRLGSTLITRSLLRNELAPLDLAPFVPVDFLNACCILLRRTVLDQIGGFDPAFFMYAEDVDFCWRAQQAGLRLGCCTTARIWHKVSRSTGVHHPQTRRWRITNQIKFYRQNSGGAHQILLILFTALRAGRLAAADLRHKLPGLAAATLHAWWQGWWSQTHSAPPRRPTAANVDQNAVQNPEQNPQGNAHGNSRSL